MKLYGISPFNYNASNWYRTMLPWRTAKKYNLADPILDNPDQKIAFEQERRAHATMYADIIQHWNNYSPNFSTSAKMAESFPSYWETKDRWNFGPHFVMDTDDNLWAVEPLNPAFRELGWKVEGKVVPKGGEVGIIGEDGKKKVLFRDGSTGETRFDVEANVGRLRQLRHNFKNANLVTTTNHDLADVLREETGAQDIHVFPNCIDFADWPKVRLAEDDTVRILWQSSSTHFEDIWPLARTLGKLQRKYKNVEIILFGSPYGWLLKELLPERTVVIGWVDYKTYILRMSILGHDINLAPLHDSEFNRCRTSIRMTESAACWKPAATLAQRTGPFKRDIIDGKTGVLFDTPEDFETKLSNLIEDATFRKTIASNAKDWVRTNLDPKVHVTELIEAYAALRETRRAVMLPPPPREENVTVPADQPDLRSSEDAGSEAGQPPEHGGVPGPSGGEHPESGPVLESA